MLILKRPIPALVQFVMVAYFVLLPAYSAIAAECRAGKLTVLVQEKSNFRYQEKSGEYGSMSSDLYAEGQVSFYVDQGRLYIIDKSIRGRRSASSYRDTGCRQYQSTSKGVLKEGIISKGKRHTAFWQIDTNATTKISSERGCMQEPTNPLHYSEEIEDIRFEGIVHPGFYKLASLCKKAKSIGDGYCLKDENGYSGQRTIKSKSTETVQLEVQEVYQWEAKKCGKGDKCLNELIKNNRDSNDTFKSLIEQCNESPYENYICDAGQLESCINNSSSPKDDFGCVVGICDFGDIVPLVPPPCIQSAIDFLRRLQNAARKEYKKCMIE